MTNLTRIAIVARKTIRYTIFFILFLLIGKVILGCRHAIYQKDFSRSSSWPPTLKYESLLKFLFRIIKLQLVDLFTWNSGKRTPYRIIPTQAKVLFYAEDKCGIFFLLDTATKYIRPSLGFGVKSCTGFPTQLIHLLTQPTLRLCNMNIITKTFSISYNLAVDKTPLNAKPPIAEIAGSDIPVPILSNANILPTDLTGLSPVNF